MLEATWQGVVIAKTEKFEKVEGNYYFPADTLRMQYFRPSEKHTQCSWKGEASYYNIVVGEQTNQDAAWFYPHPKREASNIAGRCRSRAAPQYVLVHHELTVVLA